MWWSGPLPVADAAWRTGRPVTAVIGCGAAASSAGCGAATRCPRMRARIGAGASGVNVRVYDFRVEPDGYSFRLASGDEAAGLALLRQVVSPADLQWRPAEGRWWVAPGYEVILSRCLENFDRCLASARASGPGTGHGALPPSPPVDPANR